jgi:hypothetical protein
MKHGVGKARTSKSKIADPKFAESHSAGPKPNQKPFLPPLKPRPRLFVFLFVLFVIWIVALIVLYFKTVYPQLHSQAMTPAWFSEAWFSLMV